MRHVHHSEFGINMRMISGYNELQQKALDDDILARVELKMPDVPFRMKDNSATNKKSKLRFPGLPMGSANQVVYRDLLGYSQAKIDQLG